MNIQFVPELCSKWYGYGVISGIIVFIILFWFSHWIYNYNQRRKNQDGVPEIFNGSTSNVIEERGKEGKKE